MDVKEESSEMDQSSEMDKFTCSAPVVGYSIDSDNERVMRSRLNDTKHFRIVHHRFSHWEQAEHSERNAVERILMKVIQ